MHQGLQGAVKARINGTHDLHGFHTGAVALFRIGLVYGNVSVIAVDTCKGTLDQVPLGICKHPVCINSTVACRIHVVAATVNTVFRFSVVATYGTVLEFVKEAMLVRFVKMGVYDGIVVLDRKFAIILTRYGVYRGTRGPPIIVAFPVAELLVFFVILVDRNGDPFAAKDADGAGLGTLVLDIVVHAGRFPAIYGDFQHGILPVADIASKGYLDRVLFRLGSGPELVSLLVRLHGQFVDGVIFCRDNNHAIVRGPCPKGHFAGAADGNGPGLILGRNGETDIDGFHPGFRSGTGRPVAIIPMAFFRAIAEMCRTILVDFCQCRFNSVQRGRTGNMKFCIIGPGQGITFACLQVECKSAVDRICCRNVE